MGSSLPYAEAGPEGSTRVGGASPPTDTTRFRPSCFARRVAEYLEAGRGFSGPDPEFAAKLFRRACREGVEAACERVEEGGGGADDVDPDGNGLVP